MACWGFRLLAERRMQKDPAEGAANSGMRIFTFFGLSSLLFVGVLILTYLFTHPTIDVDNRMLLPLFVGCVMSFYAAWAVWQAAWFKGKLRLLQVLPWLIAILCVAWYIPQARDEVKYLSRRRWADGLPLEPLGTHPGRAGPASQPGGHFQ